MAASTLRYEQRGYKAQETKSGVPVYDGNPSGFFEWEFRTLARYHSTDKSEHWKLASRLVEGLTGEALKVAMTMGHTELGKDTAVLTLVEKMKKHIFPLASAEARELYKMGQRPGVLSRQHGESMISYVERRRRWWNLLQKLDPKIGLSDTLLGELLLDQAGLSYNERMMVMTSTFNNLDFDVVAEALIKQHALRESVQGKGKGKSLKGGKRAYLAHEDWTGSWDDPDWTSYDDEGLTTFNASSSSYDGWDAWQAESWYTGSSSYDGWDAWYYDDGYQHDYSYYGMEGDTWDEPGTYEDLFEEYGYEGANEDELASKIQEAFLASNGTSENDVYYTKGKGKKGKGKGKPYFKGKGKGKGKKGKPYGGGNLSLEDRRQRLAEFKKRTKCQACGMKGHWAGDKECPRNNKANVATANLAVRKISDGDDKGIMLPNTDGAGVCLMHVNKVADALMNNQDFGADLVAEFDDQDADWFADVDQSESMCPDIKLEKLTLIPGHDSRMTSTQYKGRQYAEIVLKDPEFSKWVMTTRHKVPDLVRYQTWLSTCMKITQDEKLVFRSPEEIRPQEAQASESARPSKPMCKDGCKISKRGSNAYVEVRTCTICGHQTKNKKDLPSKQFEYDNCPHTHWDWRGSSKAMSRKFCLQCHTFIEEMPQEAAKARKEAAEKVASSSEAILHASAKMMRQELMELSKGEALACLKECARQLTQSHDGDKIKVGDLIQMLQENIDVITQPLTPPVANMAIGRRWADSDDWTWWYDPWYDWYNEYDNWEPERQMPIHGVNRQLREVDIMEDPGIWAILDEGCNTTCHSKEWRVNAEKKLIAKGFTMEYCHSEKSYNGVGGSAAKASKMFRIPFAIDVGPEVKSLAGVIESFELEGPTFVPMLISLSNQATLGLMKDMRAGKATLKDYGVEVELCRARQNGLFCIEIGALETAMRHRDGKLPRHLRPLRVGTEEYTETFCMGGSRRCLFVDADCQGFHAAEDLGTLAEDCSGNWLHMNALQDTVGCNHDAGVGQDACSSLDAAVIHTQTGEEIPPVSMVGGELIPGKGVPYRTGGGWKDGPGMAVENTGHVFIIGTGYGFEKTKRGDQRNGAGTSLSKESQWITNYLKGLKDQKRPLLGSGTAEADALEECLRTTMEWHLNATNKKASKAIWHCKGDQMLYEFVDLSHLKVSENKQGIKHPGGGLKGLEQLVKDRQFKWSLKELAKGVRAWQQDPEYAQTNLVLLVMDADDGCGTYHACHLIRQALLENWHEPNLGDIQIHMLEKCKPTCLDGTCKVCSDESSKENARKAVAFVREVMNLHGWINEQVSTELQAERENQKKKLEKAARKEKEKKERDLRRSRSRGSKMTPATKVLDEKIARAAVDALSTEQKHKLCLSLKNDGLLDAGINAMYDPPSKTTRENLYKVVSDLKLKPESILERGGYKDVAEVLSALKKEAMSEVSQSRKIQDRETSKRGRSRTRRDEKKESKTEHEEPPEAKEGKKKRRQPKEEIKEEQEDQDEEQGLTSVAESAVPEETPDWDGEDEKEESSEEETKNEEKKSPEEHDTGGLEGTSPRSERSRSRANSPVVLRPARARSRPKSPDQPPGWRSEASEKGQKSKGKGRGGKNKSPAKGAKGKFKFYQQDRLDPEKIKQRLVAFCNDHQGDWDERKRNFTAWYEFEDYAFRVMVKKHPRNTRMAVAPECRSWKKFALTLPAVDERWEIAESCKPVDYEEEFDDEPPHLLACILVPPWILESESGWSASSRPKHGKGKGHGDTAYFAANLMSNSQKTWFSESTLQLEENDDLLGLSFTTKDRSARRAYMACRGAEAVDVDSCNGMTGKHVQDGKQKTVKGHAGRSQPLALLVLLGLTCPFTPAGHKVIEVNNDKTIKDVHDHLNKQYYDHITVIKDLGYDQGQMIDIVEAVEGKSGMSTYVTAQFGEDCTILQGYGIPRWDGPGNISIHSKGDVQSLKECAARRDKYRSPRTVEDAPHCPEFQKALEEMFHSTVTFCHAFPAEAEEERLEELGPLDAPDEDEGEEHLPVQMREMGSQLEAEEMFDQEEQMLEEIPLPNLPKNEKERREQWMALPRTTRIAVRKMHRQFGHVAPRVLLEILRASGAKPEFLKAARILRCEGCDAHKPKAQTAKVSLPRTYEFNNTVGIDILEVKDVNGERYSILSMVDQGTCFHQAKIVRVGGSQPSSKTCLETFQETWSSWAGQPREVVTDRGLHNRGDFAAGLASRGTVITMIGVESPEMIGRTERHGGLLKAMVVRTIAELKLAGKDSIAEALNQCVITKNAMSRVKGFAPVQWVLGRLPREPGTVFEEDSWADLGSLQMASDGTTEFGKIAKIREKARKAFIRADMSSRVSRAILRKSAPILKEYGAGDLVCFRTDQSGWSTACRVIGFDGDKLAWVLHRGTPACVAIDRLRPVNASEALAYQFLHNQKPFVFGGRSQQQGYLDLREELPPVPEEEVEWNDGASDDTDPYSPTEAVDTPPGENELGVLDQEFAEVPEREGTEETRGTEEEPDLEMMPPSRRRSAEHLDDVPVQIRRRLAETQLPTESRATESRATSSASPLVQSWERAGTHGPGTRLAESGFDGANIAQTPKDEWYYDEKLGMLIRLHNDPRIALFSINDADDCPVAKDRITKGRITEVVYLNGSDNMIQDTWNDDCGTKMLGKEWTGKTVFFLKDSQAIVKGKRKKNEEETAFAKERMFCFNADGNMSKNAKKKARGKVFDYDRENQETREGLDKSRKTEWEKWMKFMAVQVVSGETLQELLKEGHKPIPTQWIDTDKNEHIKRPGVKHTPLYKSRMVARGDLEQSYSEIRTDSPTAEVEALNLLLAWCAASLLWIRSIDITNAYFHGMVLDRLMLLRPPKGGLPDKSIPEDAMMLARVPIYGTRDAGRRFWAKLKKVLTDIGLHQNSQCKALFTYQEEGDIKVMVACHVDDLLYATKPGYESFVEKILEAFHVENSKISEKTFRFCGREIEQDANKNIKLTCTSTAEKVEPVKYRTGMKKTDLANDAENAQLRSVVGSLSWVARQARPDLSYRVSKLQSICGKAQIKDLQYCNAVVKDAHEYSKSGLYFEAGAIEWSDCVLCTVSDASWSNESQIVKGKPEPYRSQRARMTLLVDKKFLTGEETKSYPIGWSFYNHQTCLQINTTSGIICNDVRS